MLRKVASRSVKCPDHLLHNRCCTVPSIRSNSVAGCRAMPSCCTKIAPTPRHWLWQLSLGRWLILLDLRERVLAGESLVVEDVKRACDDHIRKQEAGMTSLTTRGQNDYGIGRVLQGRMKAPLGSKERQEADEQVDKIGQQKFRRTPDDRHRQRMKALYVDILSEEKWNQPSREISQATAHEFLVDAMNDCGLQRSQRYMELLLINVLQPNHMKRSCSGRIDRSRRTSSLRLIRPSPDPSPQGLSLQRCRRRLISEIFSGEGRRNGHPKIAAQGLPAWRTLARSQR